MLKWFETIAQNGTKKNCCAGKFMRGMGAGSQSFRYLLIIILVKRLLTGEKKPRSTTFEVFNGISSDERHYIDSQSLVMILLIFKM